MRTEIINGMTVHMPEKKYGVSNLHPEEIMCVMYHSKVMNWYDTYRKAPTIFEAAHESMEEYAKQQALLFTLFREKYKKDELSKVDKEQKRLGGVFSWIDTPDDKIYDLFLKEQEDNRSVATKTPNDQNPDLQNKSNG